MDAATGEVLRPGSRTIASQAVPTPADAHSCEEGGFEQRPGGGVGIGEIATLPVAAAVANAVHNATARRPLELPIRPDRCWHCCANAERMMASTTDSLRRRRAGPASCSRPAPISWSVRRSGVSPRAGHRDRAYRGEHADRLGRRMCCGHRQPRGNRHSRSDHRLVGAYPALLPPQPASPPRRSAASARRRQPRAALALLVLPQPAHGLSQEGRQHLPGSRRQSSLRRDYGLGACVAPNPSTLGRPCWPTTRP